MLWPIRLLTRRPTVPHLHTPLTQHQPLCLIASPRVTQYSRLKTFALALLPVKINTHHVHRKREFRREIKLFLISDHAATFVQAVRSFDIEKGAIWRWAALG